MTIELEWKDPPPSARRGRQPIDVEPFKIALRQRPRKWALIDEDRSTGAAAAWRKRLGEGFEVAQAPNVADPKHRDIYARHIPSSNGAKP
jgi:hypothetical protein